MWERTQQIFVDSLERVLHAVARVTPGLLAMFLILALTLAVAAALRAGVRRLCERVGVDRRLREWGVAPPAIEGRTPPSRLIARLVVLAVLALGFVAGLSAVDAAATTAVAYRLLDYVPRAFIALVILAVGTLGSRAVERGVLLAAVNMGFPSARVAGVAARWVTVLFAVALALENLGIGGRVVPLAFAILLGGVVLAGALAVGLGAKDLVARTLAKQFLAGPRRLDDSDDAPEDRIQHL